MDLKSLYQKVWYIVITSNSIFFIIFMANASDKEIHFPLSIIADYTYGGVISPRSENEEFDGITGASKSRFQLSVNGDIQLKKKHFIGTGIELSSLNYQLSYDVENYKGEVKINALHLRIPLTYKIGFLYKYDDFSRLLIRAGLYVGIPLNNEITTTGIIPTEYEISKSDVGILLGLHGYPITFLKKFHIGFLVNFYRGVVNFYDDHYKFKNPLATSNLGIELKYTGF